MIACFMILCLLAMVASLILVQFKAPTQYRASQTLAMLAIRSDRKPVPERHIEKIANCIVGESQTKSVDNPRITQKISLAELFMALNPHLDLEVIPPAPQSTINVDDSDIIETQEIEIVIEPEVVFAGVVQSSTVGDVCADPGFRIHENIWYMPYVKI